MSGSYHLFSDANQEGATNSSKWPGLVQSPCLKAGGSGGAADTQSLPKANHVLRPEVAHLLFSSFQGKKLL